MKSGSENTFSSNGEGDAALFEVLYRNLSPRLYGFIYSVLRNKADTLDVLQNVFVKIWQKRSTIDFGGGNLEAYVYTTARHMSYNFLRRRLYMDTVAECADAEMPEIQTGAISDDGISADPYRETVRGELEKKISHILLTLPEQRRRIFLMSRVDGLSYRQIAERLSISENTVDTQIRRALRDFRSLIPKEDFMILVLFFSLFS